jgi:hypothetical protein
VQLQASLLLLLLRVRARVLVRQQPGHFGALLLQLQGLPQPALLLHYQPNMRLAACQMKCLLLHLLLQLALFLHWQLAWC